jgi:hypothetical protein
VRGGGSVDYCLMGTEFQFAKIKSTGELGVVAHATVPMLRRQEGGKL